MQERSTPRNLFRAGDNDTWEVFILETQAVVRKTAYCTGIPVDALDDIAQETYVGIFLIRERLDSDCNLQAYTGKVARSKAVDYLRHEARHAHSHQSDILYEGLSQADPKTVEEEIFENEVIDQTLSALTTLPAKYQELLLPRLTGFTQEEIAKNLNIPLGTVKKRTIQALRSLQVALQEEKL